MKAMIDPVFLVLILWAGSLLLMRSRFKKSLPYAWKAVIGIVVLLYLLSVQPTSNLLSYILEKDYLHSDLRQIEKLEAVVVLTGGSYENKVTREILPSHESPSRLLHALQIFMLSDARYFVCSGRGINKTSDAEAMARTAGRLGISESSIIIEPNSNNTMEHARELSMLLKDKQMRIGLITSGYHMKRSLREFRKYFKDVKPLPSGLSYAPLPMSIFTFMPNSFNLYRSSVAISEIIGNIWYSIRY
jgi:uncharacterized SAM-binding protein YcdF (DUF218 family)